MIDDEDLIQQWRDGGELKRSDAIELAERLISDLKHVQGSDVGMMKIMQKAYEERDALRDALVAFMKMAWDSHHHRQEYDMGRAALALSVSKNPSNMQGVSLSQFCWLIEAPGQNYLYAYSRKFFWTKDAGKAMRFARKSDADAAMMAIRDLDAALFEFAKTIGDAKAVEHGFMGFE